MARGVARQATEWRYDVHEEGVLTRRMCERSDGWQGTGWMCVVEEADEATGTWYEANREEIGEMTYRAAWGHCVPEVEISKEAAERLVARWRERAEIKAKVGGAK